MINNPPPLKGLNIRIPMRNLIKERGFVNQGLGYWFLVGNMGIYYVGVI